MTNADDAIAESQLPELLDVRALSAAVQEPYHNRALTTVNDHEGG